nr:hypothetical protein [Flavobacterium sp. ASV13]
MKKTALLFFLSLTTYCAFSQEVISSTAFDLKKNRDIFQTVNNEKKTVTIFISDKEKVKAINLNEKMQILDSISSKRPETKTYSNMIGYNLKNNSTRLFWSSNDSQKILTEIYNFDDRKTTTKEYSLSLKNEKVLQKFSEDENFYLLTVVKSTNNLKLHQFDNEGNYTEHVISLEGFHFYKKDYSKTNLYGILEYSFLPFEGPFALQNINVDNPTSLTDAASKRKSYFSKNQLIITNDINTAFTQLIIIDLKKFTATEKIIKSPVIPTVSSSGFSVSISSNSFLIDNKLYQIKSSSDLLYFTIKDLDGNSIKEYTADSNTPIDFKNSEIYQEGGDFFGGKRTLESSSQFIRKINNLNSGLACYHIGENTLITFGGVSAARQSGGQSVMNQFGLIGGIVGAVAFNPAMESFNSYSNRKVVKIEGLFDKNGNHIKGDLQPLAFDKIRTFFDDNTDVSSQTLFKMDFYYLGYYDNKTKEYIIRRFAD